MKLASPETALRVTPLAGGVSCEIARVDLPGRSLCVKRALPQLRVAARWCAPVERNAYEVEWLKTAARIVAGCAPEVLGHDPGAGIFAMAWLDPARYPLWKAALLRGEVSVATARTVGDRIGRIHAATADDPEIARRFATDALFEALRVDPYLRETGRVHPELHARLEALAATLFAHRRVLVHGDLSPKNVLVGPEGPVLVDAETAWFGDPAFDLAFCANHLLLKAAHRPGDAGRLVASLLALVEGYGAHVSWEPPAAVEARAAALLPALALARLDGKSPVEYLSAPEPRERIRGFARRCLRAPLERLEALAAAWVEAVVS